MIDDLKRIIESEQLFDEMIDLMMEASNEFTSRFLYRR